CGDGPLSLASVRSLHLPQSDCSGSTLNQLQTLRPGLIQRFRLGQDHVGRGGDESRYATQKKSTYFSNSSQVVIVRRHFSRFQYGGGRGYWSLEREVDLREYPKDWKW